MKQLDLSSIYHLKQIQHLSPETNTAFITWKYSLETIFSEMIRANKKVFLFLQGICTMNVLYPSLSKQFVLSICSRNPMKTQSCVIFATVRTAKCSTGCNHDDSSEEEYFSAPLRLLFPSLRKFSFLHYVTYFISWTLRILT